MKLRCLRVPGGEAAGSGKRAGAAEIIQAAANGIKLFDARDEIAVDAEFAGGKIIGLGGEGAISTGNRFRFRGASMVGRQAEYGCGKEERCAFQGRKNPQSESVIDEHRSIISVAYSRVIT